MRVRVWVRVWVSTRVAEEHVRRLDHVDEQSSCTGGSVSPVGAGGGVIKISSTGHLELELAISETSTHADGGARSLMLACVAQRLLDNDFEGILVDHQRLLHLP